MEILSALRRMGVLMGKNLLLRLRHWKVTIAEILVPFFGFLLVFTLMDGCKKIEVPVQFFESAVIRENDLTRHAECPNGGNRNPHNPGDSDLFLAYTSLSPEADKVMEALSSSVCRGNGGGSLGYVSVSSEADLEEKYKAEWDSQDKFQGAIIFHELQLGPSLPKKIKYTIRVRAKCIPTTSNVYPAPKRDPGYLKVGPMKDSVDWYMPKNPEPGCDRFMPLQWHLDQVLIKEAAGQLPSVDLTLQPFPYPAYVDYSGDGKKTWQNKESRIYFLFFFLVWSNLFMLTTITRHVGVERESGIAELLHVTGVPIWMQWVGWILHILGPHFLNIWLLYHFTAQADDGDGLRFWRFADPSFIFLIYLLFMLANFSMGFFLCVIFRKPIRATAIAVVMSVAGAVVVQVYLLSLFNIMRIFFATFLPTVAFFGALMSVVFLDQNIEDDSDLCLGARWETLEMPVNTDFGDLKLPPTLVFFVCLVVQFVGYLLLAVYLDGVLPAEHGARRPWCFFRCGDGTTRLNQTAVVTPATIQDGAATPFEPEPVGAKVGVQVMNLVKKFHNKMAVYGVSFKMYAGEIFALLGHNGAGKTTLLSMLTGFYSPSSGTALINGHDIRRDRDKARNCMGFCPQRDMLLEKLTTFEQLRLFGRLRGLSGIDARREAEELLRRVNLTDKKNQFPQDLSGGQRRTLQLALALVGGTRVVILDEPTSGMDTKARREMWELLLQLRKQRTILLTTHFMEEADALGDRIGIMAGGQLQAYGTAAFLKKFYGTLTLKLTLVPDSSSSSAPQAILTAVQKHVPNACFKTDAHVHPNQVFISLPSDTATTKVLREMFAMLYAEKQKLWINTVSLSQTTMDDVFVRAGEVTHASGTPQSTWTSMESEEAFQRSPKTTGSRFVLQLVSLLAKKLAYAKHRWMSILFSVVLLLLMFLVAVHVNTHVFVPVRPTTKQPETPQKAMTRQYLGNAPESHPNLPLNLDQYSKPQTLFDGDASLEQVIGSSAERVDDVTTVLLKVADGREGRIAFKKQHIVAVERKQSGIRMLYNLHTYHAAPLALNLVSNLILHELHLDPPVRIHASIHPFYGSSRNLFPPDSNTGKRAAPSSQPHSCFEKREGIETLTDDTAAVVPPLVSLGLVLILACFVVQPIEENMSKVKQLQTMTGVNPLLYWGSTFLFDFTFFFILVIGMLVWLLIVDMGLGDAPVLTANDGWFVFLVICVEYGFTGLCFCYLVSLRASSVDGGYLLAVLFPAIGAVLFSQLPDVPDIYAYGEAAKITLLILHYLCRLNPGYSLARAFQYWCRVSATNSDCPLMGVPGTECPEPLPYWTWSTEHIVGDGNTKAARGFLQYVRQCSSPAQKNIDTISLPGIVQELFWMEFWGLVYAAWLLIVEYKITQKLCRGTRVLVDDAVEEEDVLSETVRVEQLVASGQVATEALIVHQLCKSYAKFTAVNNLRFGVHHGECFGVLGINGAGKTTTFRIITGDETPTKGNVYGFGTALSGDTRVFLGNVGYCPQFDALLNDLTGREMLELFAGLRGVPWTARKDEALLWLRRMGLSESANVPCGWYSGGMKRRLNTAMAMIGDANLILLDEPTTGVDPVSRRQFWKVLDKVKERGQSIILTSHSMEECEALCSRLGIMVNGQFVCFGDCQHLKNKFAQGYSVTVRIKPNLSFVDPDVQIAIIEYYQTLLKRFKPSVMKDKHDTLMQFHIQDPSLSWEGLFNGLEELKSEFETVIEDYSVNETTLEEVFLALTRVQRGERREEIGTCTRCLTCRC